MSERITPGMKAPQSSIATLQGSVDLRAGLLPTHIQFRRFAGCPVCNLHLASFVRRADELTSHVCEVVVFHSTAMELHRHVGALPFYVVADPNKSLYRRFGVEERREALSNVRGWSAILASIAYILPKVIRGDRALPPLNPAGGRLSLPADFIISSDGVVTAAHYGQHVDDSWSVDEVIKFAAAANVAPKMQVAQHPS